jgi:hypothetical protein
LRRDGLLQAIEQAIEASGGGTPRCRGAKALTAGAGAHTN